MQRTENIADSLLMLVDVEAWHTVAEGRYQGREETAGKRNSVVHNAATRKRNIADWLLLVLVDVEVWHTVAEGVSRQETSMHRENTIKKGSYTSYQDALWTWGDCRKTHLPRAQARDKKEGSAKERHMRVWCGKKKDHVVTHEKVGWTWLVAWLLATQVG
eukprot:g25744.t1